MKLITCFNPKKEEVPRRAKVAAQWGRMVVRPVGLFVVGWNMLRLIMMMIIISCIIIIVIHVVCYH